MAVAQKEIEQTVMKISMLGKEGRYGEAFCLLNNILLYSDDLDDLKKAIKEAQYEMEIEKRSVELCCDCCTSCGGTDCFSCYCVGFTSLFFCCGEDVASACCGCDWMVDASSSACKNCAGC